MEIGFDRGETGAAMTSPSIVNAESLRAAARGGLGLRRCELRPRAFDRPRTGGALVSPSCVLTAAVGLESDSGS